ncbi:hypothetical protein RMSM_05664 [Rhodopirellula maiorica SM1]|uniref:Uncharacterized protein n=1 Tax=Rhodopirellula maiorica SM1 TaxID=1265738 RepID=M5RDH7_9BACT|nr:hypothetical protein [Rhodopirellula maiorica]EMI17435.1 hypothetical protein RMSM_05664 [Rhodopirellula maiorica SM1]
MATTLATEKQSEAIRTRMREIRTDLPYDVDDARQRVKQLSDWRYHMSRRPLPILAAAVVVGYWLVPAKHKQRDTVVVHHEAAAQPSEPAKKGMLGGIAAAVAAMALRQATSMAANHFTKALSSKYPIDSILKARSQHLS